MVKWKERIGQSQFSTLISIAGDDIFDVGRHKIIKRINSTRNFFSLHPTVIVADPFLFVYNEKLHLFYEEQIDLTGKGIIKMTRTGNLREWDKPKEVLKELFHLSFPNVFEVDGQVFMMPETGKDNSIKLYKPNFDLTQWTYHKTLISDKNFVDSSVVHFYNKFYLFTTDYTNSTNILRLFFADSIDGNWSEHPQSPIEEGANTGRSAGSLFFHNGKLYRPSQVTNKHYGEGAEIYEVVVLNNEEYHEKKIKSIIPNEKKIYSQGGHHFNVAEFNNQIIVATDVFEMRINVFEAIRRIIKKFAN